MEWEKSNLAISPIRHEAAFLCRVFDAVMARLLSNRDLLELARAFEGPVINGCCDLYHPSQILADLMTIREVHGSLDTTVCYVGVHNNVTNSLLLACAKLGVRLILVTPEKDELPESVQHVLADPPTDSRGDPLIHETLDLDAAVSRCRFLYTDTWVNMEHFANGSWLRERKKAMLPYQVNRDLVRGRDLFIMHDMPVHPGYEIDEYSVYGEQSVVYRQAENRLYTAQALLLELLSEDELP
jgi:ornithine carbamoyltransferase